MGSYLLVQVENMNDPAHDKPESLSQPKGFPRTPTWVITDWDEPKSKATPPKFSIRDVWGLAQRLLVVFLINGWLVLFIVAIDSPSRAGRGIGLGSLFVLLYIARRV